MLILSRRAGESLLIGESIEINILAIHHHLVRLETITEAPVLVRRGESDQTSISTGRRSRSADQRVRSHPSQHVALFTRAVQPSVRIGEDRHRSAGARHRRGLQRRESEYKMSSPGPTM
jgi:carbon storage regulator CsrA